MSDKDRMNLLSMLDAIKKIIEYSEPYENADQFHQSQRDFDAAMMNFIVLGEMVARLSDDFIEKYNHIDWFKIRGFRNIVAHEYFGIDAEEVWQIIQNHVPKLKNDLTKIINLKS
ncbi:MAG: DUF86 domain-containing protein [bacterium]|jgi:uncharacterized protein with HEPN domain|nr:DUF86 domain-containing protein [bacterium]